MMMISDCLMCLTLLLRFVVVKVHSSWSEFREYFMKQVCYSLYRSELIELVLFSIESINCLVDPVGW